MRCNERVGERVGPQAVVGAGVEVVEQTPCSLIFLGTGAQRRCYWRNSDFRRDKTNLF